MRLLTVSGLSARMAYSARQSVLIKNILLAQKRITDQGFCVKVLLMHINRCDLTVLIGSVIIDSPIRIDAACVYGNFVLVIFQSAAAALLLCRAEDMKTLADAFLLAAAGNRGAAHKCRTDKTRLRGQIPGQPDSAHTSAVNRKRYTTRKTVLRCIS